MRFPRIKADTHSFTTASPELLMAASSSPFATGRSVPSEKLIAIMRAEEAFCSVRLLEYVIMANHFHSLTAQEGRLFRTLALTKTFAMFFASFLGITLVPVPMLWLIRGRITPETKNPVNRFLIWTYQSL